MLEHRLRMEIRDQERNIVSGNRLSPKHDKAFGAYSHEPSEFMTQDLFDLVCLFNFDGKADGVDRWFD